ncbi:MAG TPA: hypothetical protein DCL41_03925 [Bdellovibrionales bacterium]|nr:hypothetical protein [Bdellovibrionales bacterium]
MMNILKRSLAGLFILNFTSFPGAFAEEATLPPDAKAMLESLPGKAVTLEVVWERAVLASDSFKALEAEAQLVEVPEIRSKALTATRVTGSTMYSDDKSEPVSAFSFVRQKVTNYSLGAETRFQTGTSLSAEISNGKYYFELPPISPTTVSQVYQTSAKVSLSQSLVKDSFGYETRKKLQAANLASQANRFDYENKVQNWSLELAQVFFQAWISKENFRASQGSLDRRGQTLRVTRIRSRRGTSEEPDLLQAQSAFRDSELALKDAHLDLKDKWRSLVISLKLPEAWLKIDPALIPLELKEDTAPAKRACDNFKTSGDVPASYNVKAMEIRNQASELQLKASKNAKLPDVSVVGSYAVNGVDASENGETFKDVQDRRFPAWSVGLKVSYPLGSPVAEGDYREALVQQVQTSRGLQQSKDQLQLTWMSLCERLETLSNKVKENELTLDQQSRRERLESRRFNIGRVPLINVIQSGDDQTRAHLSLVQARAQLQLIALQILTLDQSLFKRIEAYKQN